MKKTILGMCVLSFTLVACQNEDVSKEEDSHAHNQHVEKHADDMTEATIEGVNDHYHSGDSIELKVNANLEDDGHWHWYERTDDNEWTMIEGEFGDTLSMEVSEDREIKASYFNEHHEVLSESQVVEIHIDDHNDDVYHGYFDDEDIEDRNLSDWAGAWQSVYPYLESGALDEVYRKRAEDGEMTEAEYKEYYRTGYQTDVGEIEIKEDGQVTFFKDEDKQTATYKYDGYEILTYEKGNRGVRFIFEKLSGDDEAPNYIQFSDHIIAPEKSGHYHLYFGDDRADLLKEVDHWPTYYPSSSTIEDIKKDMLQH